MLRSLIRFFMALFVLFALAACGSNNSISAPYGSTITINPTDTSVTDKGSVITTHTQFYTITVLDQNGQPMNNAKITISFPWAYPDSASAVTLYDGNSPQNSPFDAKTDSFGIYTLRFDYVSGGGLSYFGNLEVRSGTAYQQVKFTVSNQ